MAENVAIAAAYELPPGRYPDWQSLDIYRAVLKGLMARVPIRPQDIDGVLTSPAGGVGAFDPYVHDPLISELGVHPRFAETVNLGGATFVAMVDRAATAVRAGRANAVLCIGAGKFMKPRAGGAELMAKLTSDPALEMPYGAFIPALYALSASRFMADRGLTRADLASVAVAARKWALRNPHARMHKAGELTVEEVLAARPIATPFHLYDCSLPCDGGGAVLVTREDIALRWTDHPAYVLGYGEAHARGTVSDAGDLSLTGAERSGAAAFAEAGIGPKDIDAVQLYDAFTATPLMLLENLGFCEHGQAASFVASGATQPGGTLPMNTYGGLLAFGHTGDSSGMSLLTAGTAQVMGSAGPVQVNDAKRVLIHAYGGIMFDHATLILGREP